VFVVGAFEEHADLVQACEVELSGGLHNVVTYKLRLLRSTLAAGRTKSLPQSASAFSISVATLLHRRATFRFTGSLNGGFSVVCRLTF